MKAFNDKEQALIAYLNQYDAVAIAVSGGIDSMLLAYITHRFSSACAYIFHAHSPAVPEKAYKRLKAYEHTYNWNVTYLNAQELDDKNYRENPVNRCFFCKTHLFSHIVKQTKNVILSGTNVDDLSDFRPGLEAAKNHYVKQPYVDAGITKQDIYTLAKKLALTTLESLPAQPCLASRIETGIEISKTDLQFIDKVEQMVQFALAENIVVRCRVTHAGVYVEVNEQWYEALNNKRLNILTNQIKILCAQHQKIFSGFKPYKKGSAFIQDKTQ